MTERISAQVEGVDVQKTASAPIRVLVLVTYLAMIAANVLANALPINGRTTAEVSDSYANLFAPAGITFSIWGVIYLLLGAHVLYQLGAFAADPRPQAALMTRVGILFSVSSLVNAAWIVTWHYDQILLSTLLLATMLVLLIVITRTIRSADLTTRDQVLIQLPFSVYFGWITVATIANVTVWLVSIGWDGAGISEATWTVIILLVGTVIGTAVILRHRDLAYGLVLIWAYLGIWIKHTTDLGGAYPAVSTTAVVGIVVFAAAAVLLLAPRRARR